VATRLGELVMGGRIGIGEIPLFMFILINLFPKVAHELGNYNPIPAASVCLHDSHYYLHDLLHHR
jgi:hypothetical protein